MKILKRFVVTTLLVSIIITVTACSGSTDQSSEATEKTLVSKPVEASQQVSTNSVETSTSTSKVEQKADVPKYETIEFDKLKENNSEWSFSSSEGYNDEAAITENPDGSILFDVTWNIGYLTPEVFPMDNKLAHFNYSVSSITSTGVVGFVMRCDSDEVIWKENIKAYVINIQKDKIELQRRKNGEDFKVLASVTGTDATISPNKKYDVYVGCINEKDGVRILFLVDGKEVFNYLDNDSEAIKDAGRFGIMCCTANVTLSK